MEVSPENPGSYVLHLDDQRHILPPGRLTEGQTYYSVPLPTEWLWESGDRVAVSLVLITPSEVTITAGPAVTEGANAVFTVTANPAPLTNLFVNLNVTATGNYGVTAIGPATVTILADEQTATHTVATTGDSVFEIPGSVTATVTARDGYTIGPAGMATVTINDGLSFSINDVSMNEGDSGQTAFVFTVTASLPVVTQTPVDIQTTPLTATVGVDYVAGSSTLDFMPGDLSKPFTVLVNGDTDSELDETFAVGISSVNTAPIARGQVIGTIVNDDRVPGDTDYDIDGDNLIEVSSLAQLNAMGWDLAGNGAPAGNNEADYFTAFPDAALSMGCAATCIGYELTANLDFDTHGDGRTDAAGDTYWNGGRGWNPIAGTATARSYNGVFHGNGHTISNLFIRRQFSDDSRYFAGLFGEANGRISYVALLDVNITGWQWVGALAGRLGADAVIAASYATGQTRALTPAGNYVGGLVGQTHGKIIASYAKVNVSGPEAQAGGLTGDVDGFDSDPALVMASFALGDVAAGGIVSDTAVGGLAGRVSANARVDDSYYNTVTVLSNSRVLIDRVARGKTTAQLQTPTGYTGIYAAWNVDLDGDGNMDDPWDFGEDDEYPALKADSNGDGIFTWHEFGDQGRVDHPDVSITADQSAVTEGQTARFTVSIAPAPATAVTVNLQVTAHGNYGVVGGPATVVIPANARSAAYTVTTTNDAADEHAGSVAVTVEPGDDYDALASSATVIINDNDPPSVSIASVSAYTSPGGFAEFRLTATTPPRSRTCP